MGLNINPFKLTLADLVKIAGLFIPINFHGKHLLASLLWAIHTDNGPQVSKYARINHLDSYHGFYAFSAFLLLFPVLSQDPYILNIFIISLIFSILAVSWNFICGYTGIFTFGHQAFFGLGAYASALATLGFDIDRIKFKRNLLDGICAEVVDLFKTRNVPATSFNILKKMKPLRQIEAAELMIGANSYTRKYAQLLLSMTQPEQLQRPANKNRKEALTPEQIASAQAEFMSLEAQYKLAEQSVGTDVLTMLAYRGYVTRILENGEVSDYLSQHHPDIFKEFQKIAKTSATEPQEI